MNCHAVWRFTHVLSRPPCAGLAPESLQPSWNGAALTQAQRGATRRRWKAFLAKQHPHPRSPRHSSPARYTSTEPCAMVAQHPVAGAHSHRVAHVPPHPCRLLTPRQAQQRPPGCQAGQRSSRGARLRRHPLAQSPSTSIRISGAPMMAAKRTGATAWRPAPHQWCMAARPAAE